MRKPIRNNVQSNQHVRQAPTLNVPNEHNGRRLFLFLPGSSRFFKLHTLPFVDPLKLLLQFFQLLVGKLLEIDQFCARTTNECVSFCVLEALHCCNGRLVPNSQRQTYGSKSSSVGEQSTSHRI